MFVVDTNVLIHAADQGSEATDRHARVLAATIAEQPQLRGNILHDAHTAVLMREHGITRIVTRDTDFHKFKYLEVVDPIDS